MTTQIQPQTVTLHGATVTPGAAEIISIWPGSLYKETFHVGSTMYRVPAAESGKARLYAMNPERVSVQHSTDVIDHFESEDPTNLIGHSILRVFDTYQILKWAESDQIMAMPIRAHEVAEGLLQGWNKVKSAGQAGAMGIAVRDGRPLAEQLAELVATQTIFANEKVAEANGMQAKGHHAHIGNVHRMMAKWLGVAGNLPWANALTQKSLKSCPACGAEINALALKCPTCTEFLPDFATRHSLGADDPVVAEFLARKKK